MPNTPREVHTRLSSLRLSPTRETEIVDELEQAVRSLNPDLSLTTAQTFEEIQAHSMAHTSSALGCDVCGNAQRHAAKERIEVVSRFGIEPAQAAFWTNQVRKSSLTPSHNFSRL